MLPYFTIYFLSTLLFFFKNQSSKVALAIFFFLFVFLVGCRDMIGGFDVYVYGAIYEAKIYKILSYKQFEKGFQLYFIALKFFSNDRYFMFFVTSFIMTFMHFNVIKKLSPILFFSLFIYFCKFFLLSFVYLRQGLALAFIWTAILYVDKKYIRFFFFVFIAICFHKSAIIFLPFYFISKFKIPTATMLVVSLITFFISVTSIANFLFGFLAESSNDEKFAKYNNSSGDINLFYLFEVALLTILILLFKVKLYESKKGVMILNGLFCYMIISILSLTNATFVRFSWYFLIFILAGIPSIYQLIENNIQKRHFKIAVYIYYSLLFFRLLTVYDDGDFMPYKSVFQTFDRQGHWEFLEYR